MNKRIKELIQQAGCYDSNGSWVTMEFNKEKFAELIVQACISKVSEWDMGINDPVGATDNTSEVARNIVGEIKQHFGVE
jgi:hypothetical protein